MSETCPVTYLLGCYESDSALAEVLGVSGESVRRWRRSRTRPRGVIAARARHHVAQLRRERDGGVALALLALQHLERLSVLVEGDADRCALRAALREARADLRRHVSECDSEDGVT